MFDRLDRAAPAPQPTPSSHAVDPNFPFNAAKHVINSMSPQAPKPFLKVFILLFSYPMVKPL